MSAQKGNSKTDTLVKVVLVFFISLLSFSVGTFVGKQVSDSDHRRMALEGEYKGDRAIASTSEEHGEEAAGEDAEKITDKEVESLTEEFVNKEKGHAPASAETGAANGDESASEAVDGYKTYPRGAHAPDAKETAVGHGKEAAAVKGQHAAPTKAADADATHAIANKVAHDQAPSDGAKEERKPSSALPSVASSAVGKYTVQVASYADEKQAKDHAANLKGQGWTAFYLAGNVKGRTWYRVTVGLFDNSKSAQEFMARFRKEAKTENAFVAKIIQ